MTAAGSELLTVVAGAVALVLFVLVWLATRKMSDGWRRALRVVAFVLFAGAAGGLVVLQRAGVIQVHDILRTNRPEVASAPPPLSLPIPTSVPREPNLERMPPSPPVAPPPVATPAPDSEKQPAPPTGQGSGGAPATSQQPSTDDGVISGRSVTRKRAVRREEGWQTVEVFYGTDRVRVDRRDVSKPAQTDASVSRVDYSAGRAHRLELGNAFVTVPKAHQVPNIERPWVAKIPLTNIVLYAEQEDITQHFTLQSVTPLSKEDFLERVRERLAASSEYEGHALVFVHGYNTTFDYALYRTAQISYDLGFDGAPFVYTWPSEGQILSYPHDRDSAEQAQPHLKEFLEIVMRETGAKTVSVIAHSMGNQLLLPVLMDLKRSAPPGLTISELILAAPDVGRDTFANLSKEMRGIAKGVTLYASGTDRALLASRQFWNSPRAGEVPPEGPLVQDGIETIDITALSTEIFGLNHSGFAERTPLIGDIAKIIQNNMRPPETREANMRRVDIGPLPYWRYKP